MLVGAPLAPIAPGNPLPVADSAAEAALVTLGTNTAATMAAAGTPADAAWTGSGAGTLVALLKALYGEVTGTLTSTITGVTTVSGTGAIGTTPTTSPVSVSGVDAQGLKRQILTDGNGIVQVAQVTALPAGTNTIGSVTVSGTPTVTVGNLPATQTVSGTVVLGAGSQSIGTVGVTGTVAVADSTSAASLATIAANTTAPTTRVLVSRSVASTAAGATTALVAANPARRLLRVQAPQGAGVWLNLLGGAAGANAPDCLYLTPGDVFEGQDTNAVSYWCATGGLVLSAWEA